MNKRFIFIKEQAVLDRLKEKSTEEERCHNMLAVKGNLFDGEGYLVREDWLTEKKEGDIYETGVSGVSYDMLCKYGKEYEEKFGPCPSIEKYIDYHLELVQYCIDKIHENNDRLLIS